MINLWQYLNCIISLIWYLILHFTIYILYIVLSAMCFYSHFARFHSSSVATTDQKLSFSLLALHNKAESHKYLYMIYNSITSLYKIHILYIYILFLWVHCNVFSNRPRSVYYISIKILVWIVSIPSFISCFMYKKVLG